MIANPGLLSGWHDRLIGVTPLVRNWLADKGSLTRRISQRCRDFQVQGVHQYDKPALLDEAGAVGLGSRQMALMREVYLCCGGIPVIFAHSVLPQRSLVGAWANLGRLGNRPLGAALFADPLVYREALQFRRLDARHPLYQRAYAQGMQLPTRVWARRSLFRLGVHRILVTEVFLPGVFNL